MNTKEAEVGSKILLSPESLDRVEEFLGYRPRGPYEVLEQDVNATILRGKDGRSFSVPYKRYYYYVRWWLEGDEAVSEGLYHSTFTSEMPPWKFLSNVYKRDFIGEYFLKQFETEQEMNTYWEAQIR